MEKRYFSLEEARRLLPRIKTAMKRANRIAQQMEQFEGEIRRLAENAASNAGSPAGTAYLKYLMALEQCIGGIQRMGCVVKSVQDGLVDFPHRRDGREVYLCWQIDEEDIEFYHEMDAGFADRKPIKE